MTKLNIFISHSSQSARTAAKMKKCIKSVFLQQHKLFLSTDHLAGKDWFKEIRKFLGLRRKLITLVITTPGSLKRPWVWFEVGVSWHADAEVIPVCCAGMTKSRLPDPLQRRVAVQLNKTGLAHLLKTLAEHSKCQLDDAVVDGAFARFS